MNANKILAGMALMAGISGMTGCASLTTSRKPMVEEKTEVIVKDGKTSTNTVTSVEMKPEYNFLGKTLNASAGVAKGFAGGVYAGHMMGTDTNGMANATFWDKTCNYVSFMGKGIYHGVKIGATAGWNESKEAEEKAAKEAAIRKFQEEKAR